jgi:hypothetical protein
VSISKLTTIALTVIVLGFIALAVTSFIVGDVEASPQNRNRDHNGIKTATHDGHMFVYYIEGGLYHHPDCTCREKNNYRRW